MSPIEFYQANKQAVDFFGLYHLTDRDERQLFNLGKKMIQAQAVVAARKTHVRAKNLTFDQALMLVQHYVRGLDDKSIINIFNNAYPNRPVNGGVACQLRIIAGCDKTNPMDSGLSNPGKALRAAMDDVDFDRFN